MLPAFLLAIPAFLIWFFSSPGVELSDATVNDWPTCEIVEEAGDLSYVECEHALLVVDVLPGEANGRGAGRGNDAAFRMFVQGHRQRLQNGCFYPEWGASNARHTTIEQTADGDATLEHAVAKDFYDLEKPPYLHVLYVSSLEPGNAGHVTCVSRTTSHDLCDAAVAESFDVGIADALSERLP